MATPSREAAGASPAIEDLSPARIVAFPNAWYELSDPNHFWFKWRLSASLKQARDTELPLDRPLRVLDVGAGSGILRDQLEGCTPWTVDIAELNPAALERARPGRGRTLCYDVMQPQKPLLAAYDAVLLFDVLEHIEDSRSFLRAALGHVRPGGHLLLNVPACRFLFGPYDLAAGHVRRYDKRTLIAEFPGSEVEIRDVRYWGMTMLPLLLARKWIVREGRPASERVRRGFRPPGRLAHAFLRVPLRLETAVVSRPPLGSSLLLIAQRTAQSAETR